MRLTHSRSSASLAVQSQWSHAPGTQLYTIPVAQQLYTAVCQARPPGKQSGRPSRRLGLYTAVCQARVTTGIIYGNPSGHTRHTAVYNPSGHTRLAHSRIQSQCHTPWHTAVYNPSRRDGGSSASLAVTRPGTQPYNPSGHTRLAHSRIQSQWSHAPGTQLYTIPVAETAAALLPWRSHAPGTQPYTIPMVTRA